MKELQHWLVTLRSSLVSILDQKQVIAHNSEKWELALIANKRERRMRCKEPRITWGFWLEWKIIQETGPRAYSYRRGHTLLHSCLKQGNGRTQWHSQQVHQEKELQLTHEKKAELPVREWGDPVQFESFYTSVRLP
jgi:hypothetical protein